MQRNFKAKPLTVFPSFLISILLCFAWFLNVSLMILIGSWGAEKGLYSWFFYHLCLVSENLQSCDKGDTNGTARMQGILLQDVFCSSIYMCLFKCHISCREHNCEKFSLNFCTRSTQPFPHWNLRFSNWG